MVDMAMRLWRGEIGLARTFWLWTLVIGIFTFLVQVAGILIGSAIEARLPIVIAQAFGICVSIFTLVAVWRSAGNYLGPKLWRFLARFTVIMQVISIAYSLVQFSLTDKLEVEKFRDQIQTLKLK
jgi:hypothetical protein